jgi:hypothetical protein
LNCPRALQVFGELGLGTWDLACGLKNSKKELPRGNMRRKKKWVAFCWGAFAPLKKETKGAKKRRSKNEVLANELNNKLNKLNKLNKAKKVF